MKTTLLISTYNWVNALELVLLSVKNQTTLPNEVLIADDGSTQETKQLIDFIKLDFPVPIIHVWQEDKGNRKSAILNKAIAKSIGDYIIQVDGDVILHHQFIKNHIESAQKNCYLYGSRVNIQEKYLSTLFTKKTNRFNFFSKGIKKRTRTIYFPFLGNFYKSHANYSKKMRGCNFSFWKDDFLAVNGYNEDFIGWGREDSDLAYRFHNLGLSAKRLKFKGIVYHIYHKEQSKEFLSKNNQMQQKTIDEKITFIENGINNYL